MSKMKDLTGLKFGTLTVLPEHITKRENTKKSYVYWLCKCDCGKEYFVRADHLTRGTTSSCGCGRSKYKYPHISTDRLYRIYCGMVGRCNSHKDYAGRGICLCNEWQGQKGWDNFREWALLNGYSEKLSIDRIDNNKGYCPDNCRWADDITQHNNTRANVFIDYKGKSQTIAQWARELGFKYNTLHRRISRKWSIEEAFNTPIAYGKANKNYGHY